MRIEPQNSTGDPARRALTGTATEAVGDPAWARGAVSYDALIGMLSSRDSGVGGAGPDGINATVRREMSDPLGLATAQAAVSPGNAPLLDGRFEVDGTHDAASRERGSALPGPEAQRAEGYGPRDAAQDSVRDGAAQPRASLDTRRDDGGTDGDGSRLRPAQTPRVPGSTAVSAPAAGSGVTGSGGASSTYGGVGVVGGVSGGAAGGASGQSGSLPGVVPIGGAVGGVQENASKAHSGSRPQALRSEQAEIAPQIAKGLASLVLRDGGRAQIQLRPEALGRVDVDLTVQDGVVRASLSAENETARELLFENLDRLRSLLERRGLRVESLEVLDADREPGVLLNADDGRGGRWMSAQDDPAGTGMEAGQDSDPRGDSGHEDRAWGGAPMRSAERSGALDGASSADAGSLLTQADDLSGTRLDPGVRMVRLDTVA